MTNKTVAKRALTTSALAILACIAMLIGATFAWFTDTASTAVNKIVAGNLDVGLEYAIAWDADGNPTAWDDAEGKTLNFKTADGRTANILWEPNCTYELPELRVVNGGKLALKYKVVISGIDGDAMLNDVIEWTINNADIGTEYHLGAGETSGLLTVKGHMDENANNDYQDRSIDSIGITVYATQDTVETDSINDQYDAKAEYDKTTVYFADSKEALQQAAAKIQSGDVLKITANFTMNGGVQFTTNNFTFDGQGHTITGNLNNTGFSTMLRFGKDNEWCSDILVKNLTIDGKGGIALHFHGGTTSTLENVKISGDWHLPINFYGTHGGVMKNCDISSSYADKYCHSSIFANQQSAFQLVLQNTKVDGLFVNATDTDYPTANDGIKLIVDAGSEVGVLHTNKDVTRTFYKVVNGGKVGELLADC